MQDLHLHLEDAHLQELEPVARHMPEPVPEDAVRSIYNEAVAFVCRSQAPVAGCSRDRSALKSLAEATAEDRVESLICFCCACIHPRIAETDTSGAIRWHQPLAHTGGEEQKAAVARRLHKLLSLDTYMRTYDRLTGDINISDFTDFQDWRVEVPGQGFILCCPEDHRCRANPQHASERVLCEHCEVPICKDCRSHLSKEKLPPLSLCNDMWTGYAPERLYREKVTVMEMICASPCLTMLLCMSMEARNKKNACSSRDTHTARSS